jgi:2-hydroxy-3-oxopropionate reductase
MNAKAPMMLASDFKPGFKVDLHIKDLNNALDTAHALGAPVPITALVQEMLENLHFDGRGQDDHSSLANFYAKISGTKIGC